MYSKYPVYLYHADLRRIQQHTSHTYLQCTTMGPVISVLLITFSLNSKIELTLLGTPLSGQAVKWNCSIVLSSVSYEKQNTLPQHCSLSQGQMDEIQYLIKLGLYKNNSQRKFSLVQDTQIYYYFVNQYLYTNPKYLETTDFKEN